MNMCNEPRLAGLKASFIFGECLVPDPSEEELLRSLLVGAEFLGSDDIQVEYCREVARWVVKLLEERGEGGTVPASLDKCIIVYSS